MPSRPWWPSAWSGTGAPLGRAAPVADSATSGKHSVSTTGTREFVACGEAMEGELKASVMLRAEKPDTKVRLRLSWWKRLQRTDRTAEVRAGTAWQRFEIATGENVGNGLLLDRGGRGVALLANGAQELGRQAEFGKLHVDCL